MGWELGQSGGSVGPGVCWQAGEPDLWKAQGRRGPAPASALWLYGHVMTAHSAPRARHKEMGAGLTGRVPVLFPALGFLVSHDWNCLLHSTLTARDHAQARGADCTLQNHEPESIFALLSWFCPVTAAWKSLMQTHEAATERPHYPASAETPLVQGMANPPAGEGHGLCSPNRLSGAGR